MSATNPFPSVPVPPKRGRKPREGLPPWRVTIVYPGALAAIVERRMEDVKSPSFSHFAVELVCYDLRIRRPHALTGPIAGERPAVQAAIDREIARQYEPSLEKRGTAIRALLRKAVEEYDASAPREPDRVKPSRAVYFPGLLKEAIQIRWQELGFKGISAYVTSVIRYDLLLGGPHKYFQGLDCDAEMLASLDRCTLEAFLANEQPRIRADELMEESLGRPLAREESEAALKEASRELRQRAVRASARGKR